MSDSAELVAQLDRAIENLSTMRAHLALHTSTQPLEIDKINDTAFKEARLAYNDDAPELRRMVMGPNEALRDLFATTVIPISLHFIYKFSIADKIPTDGDVSYVELSEQTGFTARHLRRVLGHASMYGLFKETTEQRVKHTAMSRLIKEHLGLRCFGDTYTKHAWRAAVSTVEAQAKFQNSKSPYQSGYSALYDNEKSFFDVVTTDPEEAKSFVLGLESFGESEGYELQKTVDGYAWGDLKDGTVVDLGAAGGAVSIEVAKKFPDLHFVNQDLIPATAPAGLPEQITSRLKFMTHDFFTPQPVHEADLYLYRMVFHNHSDDLATKVLTALIPALKPSARILIIDGTLPAPNTISTWDEVRIRNMDIMMLATFNAGEREVEDWEKLFQLADARFKFLEARKPKTSAFWFIEAEWAPLQ